jgi:hypothetical protein
MATGIVSWINPPENKGKITRTDDGSNAEFEYAINAGSTIGGYIPKMGDLVIFIPNSGKTAGGIQKQATEVLSIVSFTQNADILSWETRGAKFGEINNGVGDISDHLPDGSMGIIPRREPFVLTISNDSETLSKTIS